MKVVIVGAGALGSLYAAYLARDGHDVSLIARGERALALATHGVCVTGAETFTARCDIVTGTAFHHDVQGTLLRELTVLRLEDTRLPALR